jgi:hypothetical protein
LSKQEKRIDVTSLGQLVNVKKVNVNVDQELIMITEDRAKLCLMNFLQNMGKRDSWTTPAAIFLTVVATLATTSFRQFVVNADVWQAIFLIVAALSIIWLIISLIKRPKAMKIEDVIKELKTATKNNGEVEDLKKNPKEHMLLGILKRLFTSLVSRVSNPY